MVCVLIQIKVLQSRLFVCSLVHLLPRNRAGRGVEIDPYEASAIDVRVNLEQAVIGRIEGGQFIELWSLSQFAVQGVRPS